MAASRHDGDSQASAAICFQSFLRSLLREVSRSVTSNTHLFLLPGARSNAARHFLCRAPAKSVDGETADHAVAVFDDGTPKTPLRRPYSALGKLSRRRATLSAEISVFTP